MKGAATMTKIPASIIERVMPSRSCRRLFDGMNVARY
jgi:hypothetical protein